MATARWLDLSSLDPTGTRIQVKLKAYVNNTTGEIRWDLVSFVDTVFEGANKKVGRFIADHWQNFVHVCKRLGCRPIDQLQPSLGSYQFMSKIE